MDIKHICKICKSEFMGGENRVYCSTNCFHEGEYRNSQKYREEKRGGLVGYYKSCLFCGNEHFCIHHADFKKENNNKSNLLPLCNNCHAKVHYKILRPFIRSIVFQLKERRYSMIEIAEIIGITRQRVYQIIKVGVATK